LYWGHKCGTKERALAPFHSHNFGIKLLPVLVRKALFTKIAGKKAAINRKYYE